MGASQYRDARLPDNFWSKIRADTESGCWTWTASSNGGNPQYWLGGSPKYGGRVRPAARLAHEALIGPLEYRVDHHAARVCGNRLCVNPDPGHFDAQASEFLTAARVAAALGVHEERIAQWAREGVIPSHVRGSQRRYRPAEVVAQLQVSRIAGRVYRDGARGRSVRTRSEERGGSLHTCTGCDRALPVGEFPAGSATREIFHCRRCRRAAKTVERELLSDSYVKDQLTKKTGLRAVDMPPVLVDAHRAYLKLVRLIRDKEKR